MEVNNQPATPSYEPASRWRCHVFWGCRGHFFWGRTGWAWSRRCSQGPTTDFLSGVHPEPRRRVIGTEGSGAGSRKTCFRTLCRLSSLFLVMTENALPHPSTEGPSTKFIPMNIGALLRSGHRIRRLLHATLRRWADDSYPI